MDNVLDKKKSTKESLERIKNEHDILMERYYELRRIPGIWNQEMPDGYDVLNESKEERGKYLLTLPGRKEYIYSCVLFDNSINEYIFTVVLVLSYVVLSHFIAMHSMKKWDLVESVKDKE